MSLQCRPHLPQPDHERHRAPRPVRTPGTRGRGGVDQDGHDVHLAVTRDHLRHVYVIQPEQRAARSWFTTTNKEGHVYQFDVAISSAVEASGMTDTPPQHVQEGPLTTDMLDRMQRYWQAANYLTIGQIYLQDNPLLRYPLRPEHIKPRLLGHWGTSPGLSFIYVHLNRLIKEHDLTMIYLAGPGHGGPALVANVYLEGTYSEIYPQVSQDAEGMRLLFRQFSTPGGIPSHVSVTTPGSIHEGGELGLRTDPCLRRRLRQSGPDRGRRGRRWRGGDRAAGGVLEGHQLPQSGARRRSAAHPAPEWLQDRRPHRAGAVQRRGCACSTRGAWLRGAFRGGGRPCRRASGVCRDAGHLLRGRSAPSSRMRAPTACTRRPRWPADRAAHAQRAGRAPRWSTACRSKGTFRAHQVPLCRGADESRAPARCSRSGCCSYSARRTVRSATAGLLPELAALAPHGRPPDGRQPARQRRHAAPWTLTCRTFATTQLDVRAARHPSTMNLPAQLGKMLRDIYTRERGAGQLPPLLPGRDQLQPAGRCLRGGEPLLRRPDDRHRRPRLARWAGDGGAQRAQLRGLARRLYPDRTPWPVRDLRSHSPWSRRR